MQCIHKTAVLLIHEGLFIPLLYLRLLFFFDHFFNSLFCICCISSFFYCFLYSFFCFIPGCKIFACFFLFFFLSSFFFACLIFEIIIEVIKII